MVVHTCEDKTTQGRQEFTHNCRFLPRLVGGRGRCLLASEHVCIPSKLMPECV